MYLIQKRLRQTPYTFSWILGRYHKLKWVIHFRKGIFLIFDHSLMKNVIFEALLIDLSCHRLFMTIIVAWLHLALTSTNSIHLLLDLRVTATIEIGYKFPLRWPQMWAVSSFIEKRELFAVGPTVLKVFTLIARLYLQEVGKETRKLLKRAC